MTTSLKVALVHDWLTTYRGGEKVLEQFMEMYPEAPIYTLFYDQNKLPTHFSKRNIVVCRSLRFMGKFRKALLPLFPISIEAFDLNDFDLVISSSSCVAKGIIPAPSAKHLCYIHSPMRYIWDQSPIYLQGLRRIPLLGFFSNFFSSLLRIWDVASANRVDLFVSNSSFVASRVKKYYGKSSVIVAPPVSTDQLIEWRRSQSINEQELENAPFLIAGALVKYKAFDDAILAAIRSNIPLRVVGNGPDRSRLERLAGSSKLITFLGHCPDAMLWKELSSARALIFPGVEDFGILAIEAMACGTPVLALQKGGALDFVKEGLNGMFYKSKTVSDLAKAMTDFRRSSFKTKAIQDSSCSYSEIKFREKMNHHIKMLLEHESLA